MLLREKCPNTELFLVPIFPHLEWIRRDSKYLSVFTPNAGKYGPETTPYLDTFHTVCVFGYFLKFGIAKKLYSVRDPAFESELFQLLMKMFGVKNQDYRL